ncbi:MAG: ABC transporter permease subunit/CPBP intramembrane protease, partial [Candidatus Cloacimonadales bacterium]
MNLKKVFTIYKKEMLDILRDKRTVVSAIVVPIILYPLIMIGVSSIMSRQEQKLEDQSATIYVDNQIQDMISGKITQNLGELKNIEVMNETGDPRQLLDEGFIKAIVTLSDSISAGGFQVIKAQISYNASNEKSASVYRQLEQKILQLKDEIVGDRLTEIDVNTEILQAVDVIKDNVDPPEQMFGFFIGKILPYLLIMLTISGGAVVASDLVAGEKERGTLETILVSAAHRNELVFGKYLTIITISFITVFLNLFSMYISIQHMMSQTGVQLQEINLPLGNFALVLVAMLPLITLFAAILLSMSTFSRNIKEAQSYQMPLMLVGMMAAMISIFPAIELNVGMALIPIVNIALLFKDIMMNNFSLYHFLIVVGSTLVLDVVAIIYSVKLFNNESVLFRTGEEKSLKFWGKGKKDIFSEQFMAIFFVAVLLIFYYIGSRWQMRDLASGLIRTQLIIIALPVFLVLKISKTDLKQTLRLHQTDLRNYLIPLLAAIPLIILVSLITQLTNYIYPIPESYLEAMENLVKMSDFSLWKSLLIIALLPGICEEILFRGFLINGFTKRGFWSAVIISAILFAIIHLDPFRFLPVTVLGIWLGYLALKTNSLFVPILAHTANNAIAVLLSRGHL